MRPALFQAEVLAETGEDLRKRSLAEAPGTAPTVDFQLETTAVSLFREGGERRQTSKAEEKRAKSTLVLQEAFSMSENVALIDFQKGKSDPLRKHSPLIFAAAKTLENEDVLAKIGFRTAEIEPSKI